MSPGVIPDDLPIDELQAVFHLEEIRRDGATIEFAGEALLPPNRVMSALHVPFDRAGYRLSVDRTGPYQMVLRAVPIAEARSGIPWMNIALFLLTIASTLLVGAFYWYYIPLDAAVADPLVILQAWPFTAAVLGVLATHEMGHYLVGRYHGVDVSLPYLIPFLFPFGTLGAVIRMRGHMPDRRVLFDIGVAGPLAGLAATIVVSVIGLSLPPVTVPAWAMIADGQAIMFNTPPLLDLVAATIGAQTEYPGMRQTVSPVVIGAWVGMFFTVLNLLPVGQLDGGHIIRAMLGRTQERIAAAVPMVLFAIAGYLHLIRGYALNESVALWIFWGFFAMVIAWRGPAHPVDETPLGTGRILLGVLTFALGALCFLLVPIEIASV
jgi:membrane-associated protease RseP (regulator of RpoE activity)